MSAVEQLNPGAELLPGYTLVAPMRRGRRLDTFDVYSVERDCRCIIKTVRPDRRHEPAAIAALQQEGQLLRDLAHPNLVRCYEIIDAPLTAIVLETLSGSMLSALIEDQPLSVGDASHLGLQLAAVLGYLHRHRWLHLDVKPANIAVTAGQATLIDLSLANPPGTGNPGAGTRGYLAPEQAAGEGLTGATDVFGLGVTLGESVTGRLAYGNEATWTHRFGARPIQPRRRFARQLQRTTPSFHELVLACVEPDPAHRPTLDDVRHTLQPLT
jgi:serine/threonine protein kinase